MVLISIIQDTKIFSKRRIIKGEPAVSGVAVGKVFYYQDVMTRELELWSINENQIEGEVQRLQKAIDKVHIDLSVLKSKVASDIDANHAEILHLLARKYSLRNFQQSTNNFQPSCVDPQE